MRWPARTAWSVPLLERWRPGARPGSLRPVVGVWPCRTRSTSVGFACVLARLFVERFAGAFFAVLVEVVPRFAEVDVRRAAAFVVDFRAVDVRFVELLDVFFEPFFGSS